jgi:ribose/xylose/arabinose/galactoside ABC-type transport system permease subunit
MKFLKSWPFLSAAFVQAALAMVVAFGFHLSARQTGSIEAAAAAVLALLVAPHVKEVVVPLAIGALTAMGALLVAFKLPHVSSAEVSAFVAALVALLGMHGHSAVTNKLLQGQRLEKRGQVPQRL